MALPFAVCSARRLDEIVQQRLLCVFAFDGTLVPNTAQPEQARVPLGLLLRLRALASYAPVGVITGQSLPDVHARLEFAPDFVIGSHGLDGAIGSGVYADGFRPSPHAWDKTLSVALTRQALFMEGDSVVKLVPPGTVNKGAALEQLMRMSGAESVLYVGDEAADEDVFQLRRPDMLTVRIGMATNTKAEFFLPQRLDVFQVLDKLIGRLRHAQSTNWLHIKPVSEQYRARG
jgi:trehalose 6-phosphate phosphatase